MKSTDGFSSASSAKEMPLRASATNAERANFFIIQMRSTKTRKRETKEKEEGDGWNVSVCVYVCVLLAGMRHLKYKRAIATRVVDVAISQFNIDTLRNSCGIIAEFHGIFHDSPSLS